MLKEGIILRVRLGIFWVYGAFGLNQVLALLKIRCTMSIRNHGGLTLELGGKYLINLGP